MKIENYQQLKEITAKSLREMTQDEMAITQIHGTQFQAAVGVKRANPQATKEMILKNILLESSEECRQFAGLYDEEFWKEISDFCEDLPR